MCSDSPDYSGMNAAALANADIAKEALSWYKGEAARTQGQRDATTATANQVAQTQLETQNQQNELTQDYADYQKNTFRPLEQKIVDESQNYNTAARRDEAAAQAGADVETAMAANQQAMQRNIARMGGSVSADRALALQQDAALAGAKAKAGATTTARRNVETVGRAMMSDAANLGRNLASNQATSASVALQAGNSAVGNSGAATTAQNGGAALMGQGFNTAIQGNQSAGNIYGQVASMQQKDGGVDLGGLASLGMAGAKLWALSDEDIKSDTGKKADTAETLKQVDSTPVEEGWRYDPAKGGPDEGGAKHTGPMAQKVRATMGDSVAPGGKVIDLVSMNGKLMGAVQELSKQQKATQRQVARMAERIAA
jgi:hypothetical protein